MRYLLLFIGLILSAVNGWSAAMTTVRAGDWSNTTGGVTPWTALTGSGTGGVPGTGDTVSISHAVTVDTNQSIGTSPSTEVIVATITNTTGAGLTIAAGVTLTIKGGIVDQQSHSAGVTVGAGGGIEFDASAAGGVVNYPFKIASSYDGGQSPGDSRGWRFNGTQGSRSFMRSVDVGGNARNAYHSNAGNGGEGCIQATYTDFIRIGDETHNAWSPLMDNRKLTNSLSSVTFRLSGQLNLSMTNGDATLTLTDVSSTESLTNESTSWPFNYASSADKSAGSRTWTRVVSDKQVKFNVPQGLSMTACVFNNYFVSSGAKFWASLADSFIRITNDGGGVPTNGGLSNNFVFYDNSSKTNAHGLSLATVPSNTQVDWIDNVYQFNGTDSAGNAFLFNDGAATSTATFKRNIILPNADGENSGVMMTWNNAVTNGFLGYIEHNTANVESQHGLEIGHLYGSVEAINRYASVKSNLFWGVTSDGYKANNVDGNSFTDIMPPSVVTHNAGYLTKTVSGNPTFTNEGKGYASKFSVTPGANDLDGADPQFVDSSRKFSTWDASLGGAGTEAAALARIIADPTLTASSLLPYIKAGYAPRSTSYAAAAHDGGTIGAMEYTSGGGGSRVLFPGFSFSRDCDSIDCDSYVDND